MKKKNNNLLSFGIIGVILLALLLVIIPSAGSMQLQGKAFVEKYTATGNAVLVDVRTPDEFASGHIASAINVDFDNQSFTSEIQKLDTSKTYFVYCRSGNRSGKAIAIMKNNGFKNMYELQGGIVSNQDALTLVTTTSSNTPESAEYVVDASDMVNGQALIGGIKKTVLNAKEINGLIQMREEEKLAHDVYVTLGDMWGARIFSNISQSEQTHTDAIKVLLERYVITDPVTTNTLGVFHSKDMQKLYDSLIIKGKTSLSEALVVGATVEDLDIRDLNVLKTETNKEDILATYTLLQKGSRNHMRAFIKNIEVQGSTYIPQYISQNEYTSIINSPQERGR